MSLQQKLYQFCRNNELEDIACIIQFTIVNYVSSHKSNNDWVYLSSQTIDSFLGIGEDKINKLFADLSLTHHDCISISYETFCPIKEDKNEFCETINLEDYDEDEEIELNCSSCGKIHTISHINEIEHKISYEGNKEKIIKNLKISGNDIVKEMIVVNTNEEHLNKLTEILISRLTVEQGKEEEAKKGIIKILGSVKAVTGLISGIAGDVSDTSNSVKNIIEDLSGLSTFKGIFK